MKKLISFVCAAIVMAASPAFAAITGFDGYLAGVMAGTVTSSGYKCALLGAGYTANKGTHVLWSDVSASEITGTNYTSGGMSVTPTFATDTTNHNNSITFPTHSWATATVTASYEVCYHVASGRLVLLNSFGASYSATAGTFQVGAETLTFGTP